MAAFVLSPAASYLTGISDPDRRRRCRLRWPRRQPRPAPRKRAATLARRRRRSSASRRGRAHRGPGQTIPDLIGPGLRVLFSGINPSLYSAAIGHHFARPGNRFWPALHGAGFTDRLLHPSEQLVLLAPAWASPTSCPGDRPRRRTLPRRVDRGRRGAGRPGRHLAPAGSGGPGRHRLSRRLRRPKATLGPQEEISAGYEIWVLPNPSGLNAHYQMDGLAAEFAICAEASESVPRS